MKHPAVSGTNAFETIIPGFLGYNSLYNGNISAGTMNLPALGSTWHYNIYQYDQLNRLTKNVLFNTTGPGYTGLTYSYDYNEVFAYDRNGNMQYLYRTGNTISGTDVMDNLIYRYNTDGNGRLINNRLRNVSDVAADSHYTNDIKNQATDNYTYDATGNLATDSQAGISNIDWSVYGKINTITKTSGNINYFYNTAQQRTKKRTGGVNTYYVRDAQGNTLAVYDNKGGATNWREQHLYGSSRLGMWLPNLKIGTDSSYTLWDTLGHKRYELSNHLGNVMATITDRRLQQPDAPDTSVAYFKPDVANAQEYYAFGSMLPGRTYIANANYRYGFNGKENDNEVKGAGNEQDYGIRIYDPRVGRFLSVDPITRDVPGLTPYQFGGNSPIAYIDLDGLEPAKPKGQKDFMSFFVDGVQDGLNDQADEAKYALIKVLSNPESYHKLDEIADQAMRDPVKLVTNIDKSVSKAAKKMAIAALKDAAKVGAAFLKDENKGYYEAGKFIAKYGLFLLAPEEEGIVVSTEGITSEGEIKALAESTKSIATLRREAVSIAWKEEKELVLETGQGTRRWTKAETEELKTTGKVKGYHGHHINSVNGSPELAGDPNNIEFVKGAKENLRKHGGNFKNQTRGPLINRKEKIETLKQNTNN
ncbi:MAG: RHS repeat-associated core domain-containing protein [Mucilaginibacter sp.]